jgi:hypothetical protein
MANFKIGPMGMSSGSDDPQTPSYKKLAHVGEMPAKQVAHENLPSRHARATITGGDPIQRSMNNYSKMTPADANGVGSMGTNIFAMGRNLGGR